MRIIIADDNYAKRLADVFKNVDEFKSVEILTAANLEEAKQAIEASDGTETVVLTDMFLPDKADSTDADEALAVYREICERYSVNARMFDRMMDQVRPMINELYQKSASLRSELKKRGIADISHDELMTEHKHNLRGRKDIDEDMQDRLNEWFNYARKHGEDLNQILRNAEKAGMFDGFYSYKLADKSGVSGVAWGFGSLPSGIRGGGCEGMPMGVRIAQEAHKHGLPVAVVSGDHGTTPLPLVALYLRDTGIIGTAKFCGPYDVLEYSKNEFKPGGKERVADSDFFICNKGYEAQYDYNDAQKWADNLLIEIVRMLIKRLG